MSIPENRPKKGKLNLVKLKKYYKGGHRKSIFNTRKIELTIFDMKHTIETGQSNHSEN